MPDIVFWPLFVSFAAIAIGAVLKMVEALHGKKLSDDECSRLRAQLDILNNPKYEKTIDIQPFNSFKTIETTPERIDKIKEDILILLSRNPDTQSQFFAQETKVGNQVALHHLEAMKEMEFVSYYWRNKGWKLQPKGRAYLVSHNLIS